jgi:hypothetical protein
MARAKRDLGGVAPYKAFFEAENEDIALENSYSWDNKFE